MRVIGGHFRSRKLIAPRGTATRPTSDRLRETLFNVLGPRLQGARFLDLFAGSGAVGIEALSRGALTCHFVERAPPALVALRANLAALGVASGAGGAAVVDSRSVARALQDPAAAGGAYDLVALDPPYEAAGEYTSTLDLLSAHAPRLLAPGAVVVAEHARRDALPESFGALRRYRLLEQGDAALSFYAIAEPEPA